MEGPAKFDVPEDIRGQVLPFAMAKGKT